jgi:hypothetical protein
MPHPTSRLIGFALATMFAASAQAAIFTVGSGTGCTHATIQAAVNAAAASPGADTVRITRSLSYESQAVVVNTDQDLNIVGGFATCTQSATDSTYTSVSGTNAKNIVFDLLAYSGATIKLRFLDVKYAMQYGIRFRGAGALEVIESTVERNKYSGIYADATNTPGARLTLSTGTLILQNGQLMGPNNTYSSGGGVSLWGPITFTMNAPQTMLGLNTATHGGGLYVGDGATAYIGSPGYGNLGALHGNTAGTLGGGAYVLGTLKLFSTDASKPVKVTENTSNFSAGGVYVRGSAARVCAWDFAIDGNHADFTGGAVGIDDGKALLNRDDDPTCTPYPGAVRCTAGEACSTLSRNSATHDNNYPSTGAIVSTGGGYFGARRLRMRNNTGHYAFFSTNGNVHLNHALIADNTIGDQLAVVEGSNTTNNGLTLLNSTIANNAISGSAQTLFSVEYYAALVWDVIDQPRQRAFGTVPSILSADYLLVTNQLSALGPRTVVADPWFVDPTHGDYHLQGLSPAVDFAVSGADDTIDLDGKPRIVDLPGIHNTYGPRDLGAYELQSLPPSCAVADTVFCDAFESP